jgi:NAD(P)-dependent dehydrogenase (short-subunit alcohol dehydrogenase family)
MEKDMEHAQRKTVVVTGSTKGIGKAIVFRLAQEHYNVVLNYASDEKAVQAA